jgi:hypothetical protein
MAKRKQQSRITEQDVAAATKVVRAYLKGTERVTHKAVVAAQETVSSYMSQLAAEVKAEAKRSKKTLRRLRKRDA